MSAMVLRVTLHGWSDGWYWDLDLPKPALWLEELLSGAKDPDSYVPTVDGQAIRVGSIARAWIMSGAQNTGPIVMSKPV